jgi:pimeloyl-ACP methyl ester carboxylesterase
MISFRSISWSKLPACSVWRFKSMKRVCKSLLMWTSVWFLAAFAFAFLATHQPFAHFAEPAPALDWGTVETHRLTTNDGEELGAWFVNHSAGDQPAVVFFHGLGAGRSQLLDVAAEFHRRGCPVLLVTQRAHGDSTGGYNDFGFSGGPDVVAAVDWLRERLPGRKLVVWGTSMGAAAALFGAETLGDKVAGYVLECPYQNLRVATRNRTRFCLPPVVEACAYHTLDCIAPIVLPKLDQISPEDAAAKVPPGIPVLLLAGERDFLAQPGESHAIAARIGSAARVVIVPGAGHTVLMDVQPEVIRAEIAGFLERVRLAGQEAETRK